MFKHESNTSCQVCGDPNHKSVSAHMFPDLKATTVMARNKRTRFVFIDDKSDGSDDRHPVMVDSNPCEQEGSESKYEADVSQANSEKSENSIKSLTSKPMQIEEQKSPSPIKEQKSPRPIEEQRSPSPIEEQTSPSPIDEQKFLLLQVNNSD